MRTSATALGVFGLAASLLITSAPAEAAAYRGPNSLKQAKLEADLAQALRQRDGATLTGWMNAGALARRALPRVPRNRALVKAAVSGGAAAFCADLALEALGEAGRYAPQLRAVRFEAGPDAVYLRYFVEDRGMLVAALQFYVVAKPDGSPTIIDFSESYRGQMCSASLRRRVVAARPAVARALPPALREWAENADALQQIMRLNRAGKHWAAVEAYERFPAAVQRDYQVGVSLMWNAMHLASSQQFHAAATLLFDRFGDDPGLLIRAHDFYFVKDGITGLPRALDYLERLDRVVGHDPAIDELRALYMKPLQRPLMDVQAVAERAIAADPERVLARIALFEILANRGDHLGAAKHLDALNAQLPEPRYKALLSEYPAFLGSLPYRHWAKFKKPSGEEVALGDRAVEPR